MVRDFTKSAISLSWALSLLGLRQTFNLFRPGQQRGNDMIAPITQSAVNQFDDSLRGIYRSGDSLQSGAVDMAFLWLNPVNWFNPNAWLRPFAGCGQRGQGNGQNQGNDCGQGQDSSSQVQNPSYGPGNGQGGNGFTQAAAGISQAVGQAASGFTQAVGQATAGLTQAVTGYQRQPQNGGNVRQNNGGNAPVSNDSAASGWSAMPGNR